MNQLDNAGWDAFVVAHPQAHLLQSSAWGALKSRFEWQASRVVIDNAAGQPCAGSLLLYRRAYGLTLAYAPKGPLTNWQDRTQSNALLAALTTESRRHGAALLKIEPNLPDTLANRALLRSYGFVPSLQTIQPPSSIVLDVTGTEEELLQRMKSKWRYNIRLAERKGVTVRAATRADLPAFNQLMHTTGARDGFAVHSAAYYSAAYDLFVPNTAAYLLAEYAGQPLAALVVMAVGKTAWYLWGASGDSERNRMPNYALQWAAMRWARARGATHYDLWGIPDELGKLAVALGQGNHRKIAPDDLPVDLEALPSGELWGVYRFKQGFGGQVVRSVGAWDRPVNAVGYGVYQLGLGVRQQVATLKRMSTSPLAHLAALATKPANDTQLQVDRITHRQNWQHILATLPAPHVLQSWEWGAIKAQTEWTAERLALRTATGYGAAFQFLWRQPLPHLPLRVGYVPKGPVVDWANAELVDCTLAQIEAQARSHGCIFVKIDPDVREDTTAGRLVQHALFRRGWSISGEQVQFKNTAFTDLTMGEAHLAEEMKSKWRYNVRLAEKRGLRVRTGSVDDLAAFYTLYAETGARDGFLIRPFDYYRTTWQGFLQAQAESTNPAGGALLLAEHPDDPLPVAALFLLRYGQRTWYFYGASSERHRRDMPNYLLQWEALRWAIAQGCTSYDWWGAPTNLDDLADGMQGVWQFKQGFGAALQNHIGAWDFPVSPLLYQAYTQALPQVLAWLKKRGG